MGLDSILVNMDQATFESTFMTMVGPGGVLSGMPATVAVRPDPISARGPALVKGQRICVEGDEKTIVVPGCMYTAGPYSIPGVGVIMIHELAADQKATKGKVKGKAILLKGSNFTAVFNVLAPAKMPPPASTPDPAPKYYGKGKFMASNTTHKAT